MNTLYITHPEEKTHNNQIEFLYSLQEPMLSEIAQQFRIGNAQIRYYLAAEPNTEDYQDWLEGLPEIIRKEMVAKGFTECKNSLALLRHTQERKDLGMTEYLRRVLNADDFEAYRNTTQPMNS